MALQTHPSNAAPTKRTPTSTLITTISSITVNCHYMLCLIEELPPLLSVFQYLHNLVVTARFREFKSRQLIRVLNRISLSAYTQIAHEWATHLECPVYPML